MAFKLNSPYKINPISVHEVAFTPDNEKTLGDGPEKALVAKANDNGTIIINKDIPKDSELYNNAISHEGQHLKDMMDNKLSYDEENVYENIDGKGIKKHNRDSFSESDKNLPWEKGAYSAGDNKVQHDLRPKPDKLSGPPSMRDETPLAFKVMGSRHNEQRSPDKEKISMNEQFGMYAPTKQWGGPSQVLPGEKDPPVSGLNNQSDAGGNDYTGAKVSYSMEDGFNYKSRDGTFNKKISNLNEVGGFKNESNALDADIDREKYPNYSARESSGNDARRNENRGFNNLMNTVNQEKDDFFTNNSYVRDNPRSTYENISVPGEKGGRTDLALDPTWQYNNSLNQRDNIDSMRYTSSSFDKDGKLTSQGGIAPLRRAAGADPQSLQQPSSVREKMFGDAKDWKTQQFLQNNTTLRDFQASHPNTFSYTSGNAGT